MTVEDSCLMIIDAQEKLIPAMAHGDQVLDHICRLIQGAMILGVPTLATEQYPKGLGKTVPQVMECYRGNVPTISKTAFGALDEQDVMDWMMGLNRRHVILCGMETHICLRHTALQVMSCGFLPVVVSDCTGSRKDLDHDTAILEMRQRGVRIQTLESVLFELLKDAKAEQFKEISALVK